MALATLTTSLFTALAATVTGHSELGRRAESGESVAILITTFGYAGGVIAALMSLLLCLKPVIEGRSRAIALTAGLIAVMSPLIAAALSPLLGIR